MQAFLFICREATKYFKFRLIISFSSFFPLQKNQCAAITAEGLRANKNVNPRQSTHMCMGVPIYECLVSLAFIGLGID
jgi:hypothetical protein